MGLYSVADSGELSWSLMRKKGLGTGGMAQHELQIAQYREPSETEGPVHLEGARYSIA
jgi:hypothetical protein